MNATTKMRTTWSSRTRTSTPCESQGRINYYPENMGPRTAVTHGPPCTLRRAGPEEPIRAPSAPGPPRQAHPDVRVNLTQPEVEIHVEVRRNRGFVFREIWPGPGGLPLGSQGRALAVVQDEAGMVAAWMGMKRGCRIAVATSDGEGLVEPLRKWDMRLKVLGLPADGDLGDLIRIARAEAIFLGAPWEKFDPKDRTPLDLPPFEPVMGLRDEEIVRMAARIRSA